MEGSGRAGVGVGGGGRVGGGARGRGFRWSHCIASIPTYLPDAGDNVMWSGTLGSSGATVSQAEPYLPTRCWRQSGVEWYIGIQWSHQLYRQ